MRKKLVVLYRKFICLTTIFFTRCLFYVVPKSAMSSEKWNLIGRRMIDFLKTLQLRMEDYKARMLALPADFRKYLVFAFIVGLFGNVVLSKLGSLSFRIGTPSDPPSPVLTEVVETRDIKNSFSAFVSIQPSKDALIRPNSGVTVKNILVSVGSPIKKGEKLVEFYSELQALRAELNQIDLQLRTMDFNISMSLARKNFLSRKEREQKVGEHRAQQIRTRIAKLESADEILAPFDGIVSEINMKEGDYVDNPSNFHIRLIDSSSYKVQIHVPQGVAQKVKPGDEVTFSRNTDGEKQEGIGEILAISPAIDSKTGTVLVEIASTKIPDNWMVGVFAELQMTVEESPSALAIPRAAVVYDKDQTYVFVVKEDESTSHTRFLASFVERFTTNEITSRARKIPVKLGIRDSSYVEVEQGLEEFDQVVIEGQGLLSDGTKVEVAN